MNEIVSALKGATTVLVAAHVSPDADAVGSSCALSRSLSSLGKRSLVYLADKVPAHLLPLIGDTTIVHVVPSEQFDLLVVVDTATKDRVGKDADALFAVSNKRLVIDHHISNTRYGEINYVEGDAPSSASIIYALAQSLGSELDQTTLNLLYAGLCDDTGSFRFSNATPRAFRDAESLVSRGAEVSRVAELLFFSVPLNRLKLRARALERLELICDNKVSFTFLDLESFQECEASPLDSEGVIDDIRAVQGVEGAVFMREVDEGFRFSLRSKSLAFDANQIASRFGGGGHRAAAGCTIKGVSASEAKERMVTAISELV